MTTVYLIRHANAYDIMGFQEPDTPLRGQGPAQAKILAQRLKLLPIDVVYTSPYERSHETATVYVKLAKKAINIDPRLKEIGTAEWTAKDFSREKDRIEDVLLSIVAKNRGKTIAIFAHGNLIKTLLCKIVDASLNVYNNKLFIGLASITTIYVQDTGLMQIVSVSDTAHETTLC